MHSWVHIKANLESRSHHFERQPLANQLEKYSSSEEVDLTEQKIALIRSKQPNVLLVLIFLFKLWFKKSLLNCEVLIHSCSSYSWSFLFIFQNFQFDITLFKIHNICFYFQPVFRYWYQKVNILVGNTTKLPAKRQWNLFDKEEHRREVKREKEEKRESNAENSSMGNFIESVMHARLIHHSSS